MIMTMSMSMILSSIDIEVIRTVYYFFFIKMILHKKKHTSFVQICIPKKHNKQLSPNKYNKNKQLSPNKQLLFRCKAMNFCSNIDLKKFS